MLATSSSYRDAKEISWDQIIWNVFNLQNTYLYPSQSTTLSLHRKMQVSTSDSKVLMYKRPAGILCDPLRNYQQESTWFVFRLDVLIWRNGWKWDMHVLDLV